MLGTGAYEAYKRGDVALADFVAVHRSRERGDAYRRGSLRDALAA